MSHISLQHVNKSFIKDVEVIKDVSLEIFDDEFLVFVGPSGSGKTTTLRMIAGLEEITSGDLYINGVKQNDQDPSTRELSFVFQNYALLPNLTVYQNILFGLLNKKMSKLEKKKRVEKIANKLSLDTKLGSYPAQLSGGQKQRVALARALVDNEKLILFDEPLSNLDAVLRAEMRSELIRFQNEFGITCIYVTHDQIEAMAMASRIVLMMDGKVIQVGTPLQMYDDPAHLDVATFIGSPETNVLKANLQEGHLVVGDTNINVNDQVHHLINNHQDDFYYLSIRPNQVKISYEKLDGLVMGKPLFEEHFGFNKLMHIECLNQQIKVLVHRDFELKEICYLDFSGSMYVFDSAKRRIRKDENKEIKLGEMTIDKDLEHVIKELENYGYVFTLNNEKPDVWFDQQKQYYILRMNDTNHVLKNIKDLLKYYSFIK